MINKTKKLKGVLSDIEFVYFEKNQDKNNRAMELDDQNKNKIEYNQRMKYM